MPCEPEQLRQLAIWHRDFAERAGNSAIWDARLRTAEDLEALAALIERRAYITDDARVSAIEQRAYALWEQEGRPQDRSLDHWLQAETELDARQRIAGFTDDGRPVLPKRD